MSNNPFANDPPIDTSVIPACADLDPGFANVEAFGDNLVERWNSKNITNIKFLIWALTSAARDEQIRLGQKLLSCRMEINRRNFAIAELRADNARQAAMIVELQK